MRLRRQNTDSMYGRHHLGAPRYTEIQKQLGKALIKHYEPPPELPHHLLTLLIQLNDKDNDKE
jgi:hypothetical protein